MNTATITKTRGLFQISKVSEKSWSCHPVVYGSVIAFAPKELNVESIDRLMSKCNIPALSFVDDRYVVEFFDGMSVEELVKFGFERN